MASGFEPHAHPSSGSWSDEDGDAASGPQREDGQPNFDLPATFQQHQSQRSEIQASTPSQLAISGQGIPDIRHRAATPRPGETLARHHASNGQGNWDDIEESINSDVASQPVQPPPTVRSASDHSGDHEEQYSLNSEDFGWKEDDGSVSVNMPISGSERGGDGQIIPVLLKRFEAHRQALRDALTSLMDTAGNRLFSDEAIRAQLDSGLGTNQGNDGISGDGTLESGISFGQNAYLGLFHAMGSSQSRLKQYQVPVADILQDNRKPQSYEPSLEIGRGKESPLDIVLRRVRKTPSRFLWVHLPANNLHWVTVGVACLMLLGPR